MIPLAILRTSQTRTKERFDYLSNKETARSIVASSHRRRLQTPRLISSRSSSNSSLARSSPTLFPSFLLRQLRITKAVDVSVTILNSYALRRWTSLTTSFLGVLWPLLRYWSSRVARARCASEQIFLCRVFFPDFPLKLPALALVALVANIIAARSVFKQHNRAASIVSRLSLNPYCGPVSCTPIQALLHLHTLHKAYPDTPALPWTANQSKSAGKAVIVVHP